MADCTTANSTTTPRREELREKLKQQHREFPSGIHQADWVHVPEQIREQIETTILNEEWPMLIYGSQGRGKSYAAAMLYAANPSRLVSWYRLSEFMRHINACRSSQSRQTLIQLDDGQSFYRTETQMWRVVRNAHFLVVDDIGIRSPTDAQFEMFFELLEVRNGKRTVMTSNLDPKELAQLYDARIASRLVAGSMIHFDGVDRRQRENRINKPERPG